MKTKSISKLFFYLCNFVCLLVLLFVPLCYLGGGGNSSRKVAENSTITAATVSFDKLVEPIFAETKQKVESATANVNADIANRKSLQEHFKSDINTWVNGSLTVKDINSPEDISGTGVESDPYIIKTVRGWTWFIYKTMYKTAEEANLLPDYTYAQLGNDLDFGEFIYDFNYMLDTEENYTHAFVGFYGSFDGKGYELQNLALSQIGLFSGVGCSANATLFGSGLYKFYFDKKTEIRNLNIKGYSVNEMMPCILALHCFNATIENVNAEFVFPMMGLFTYADHLQTNIINCNFNFTGESCFVVGAFTADYIEQLNLGVQLEGSVYENCNVNFEVYGGDAAFVMQPIYNCENSKIINCTATGHCFGSYGLVNEPYYLEGQLEITNCKNYVIAAGQKVGGILMSAYYTDRGGKYLVKNCENYGDLYCNVSATDTEIKAGGIVGRISDFNNFTIENCNNYGNIYSTSNAGGIVGETSRNVSLVITNSANYGNVTLLSPSNVASIGGIVGKAGENPFSNSAEYKSSIIVEGCKNFGDLEYGARQGGIIGWVSDYEATVLIKKSENHGNLLHAFFENGTTYSDNRNLAYQAGIVVSSALSTTIDECLNTGNFVGLTAEEAKALCQHSSDTSHYAHNVEASGILTLNYTRDNVTSSSKNAPTLQQVQITNCTSSATFANILAGSGITESYAQGAAAMYYYLDHSSDANVQTFLNGYRFILKGCKSYASFKGELWDGMRAIPTLYYTNPTLQGLTSINCIYGSCEISNNYSEVVSSTNPMTYTLFLMTGDDLNSTKIENNQSFTYYEMTVDESDLNEDGVLTLSGGADSVLEIGSWFGGDGRSNGCDGVKNMSVKTKVRIKSKVNVTDAFRNKLLKALEDTGCFKQTSDSILYEFELEFDNDKLDAKFYHNLAGTAFDDAIWGWVEGIDGAKPVLKNFFWQAYNSESTGNLAKLEELGFTKYNWTTESA